MHSNLSRKTRLVLWKAVKSEWEAKSSHRCLALEIFLLENKSVVSEPDSPGGHTVLALQPRV